MKPKKTSKQNTANKEKVQAALALLKKAHEGGMSHAEIAVTLHTTRRSVGHFLSQERTLPDDVLDLAIRKFSVKSQHRASAKKSSTQDVICKELPTKSPKVAAKKSVCHNVSVESAQSTQHEADSMKTQKVVKTQKLRDLKLSEAVIDRVSGIADVSSSVCVETALLGLLAVYESAVNQIASLNALAAKKEARKKPVAENEYGRGFYGVFYKEGLFCGFVYDLKKSESGHILIRVRPGVSIGLPYVQQAYTKIDLPYGSDQKDAECAVLACLADGSGEAYAKIVDCFMRARADYMTTISGIKRLGHIGVLLSDWRDMLYYVGVEGDVFAKPVIDRIRQVMVRLTSPK